MKLQVNWVLAFNQSSTKYVHTGLHSNVGCQANMADYFNNTLSFPEACISSEQLKITSAEWTLNQWLPYLIQFPVTLAHALAAECRGN